MDNGQLIIAESGGFTPAFSALSIINYPLSITFPIHLEFFSGWVALLLFLGLGSFIVLLGMRSLNGLGKVRKWVAIGLRLAVLLLFILIIGGIRWQRMHKDLEVMALVDVSGSMRYFTS